MINKVHLVMWLCLYLDNNAATASVGVGGEGVESVLSAYMVT